jgi:hypothetical protein
MEFITKSEENMQVTMYISKQMNFGESYVFWGVRYKVVG